MNDEKNLSEQLSRIYPPGESKAIAKLIFEKIGAEDKEKLSEAARRLLNHEPVQYILNESWFCNLPFYVDRNVLIPRQETEELVEWIVSGISFPFENLTILDVGTGSGCIAIALKRRLRKADVWACDISSEAINIAGKNSADLGAPVNFLTLDFLDPVQRATLPSFDIIVSNPPYIPRHDMERLAANVRDYEPQLALFVPSDNAILFYEALADFAGGHLNKGGKLYAELHEDYADQARSVFKMFKTELKRDMQGKYRMIRAVI